MLPEDEQILLNFLNSSRMHVNLFLLRFRKLFLAILVGLSIVLANFSMAGSVVIFLLALGIAILHKKIYKCLLNGFLGYI